MVSSLKPATKSAARVPERRRGGAPKGAPVRVMDRWSAAIRRSARPRGGPMGAAICTRRLSALRPPHRARGQGHEGGPGALSNNTGGAALASGSPDEAQRNPGQRCDTARPLPDYASLHPGYGHYKHKSRGSRMNDIVPMTADDIFDRTELPGDANDWRTLSTVLCLWALCGRS